jgi:hypothetical protein
MRPEVAVEFTDRATARRGFDEAAQCLSLIQRTYETAATSSLRLV